MHDLDSLLIYSIVLIFVLQLLTILLEFIGIRITENWWVKFYLRPSILLNNFFPKYKVLNIIDAVL